MVQKALEFTVVPQSRSLALAKMNHFFFFFFGLQKVGEGGFEPWFSSMKNSLNYKALDTKMEDYW